MAPNTPIELDRLWEGSDLPEPRCTIKPAGEIEQLWKQLVLATGLPEVVLAQSMYTIFFTYWRAVSQGNISTDEKVCLMIPAPKGTMLKPFE